VISYGYDAAGRRTETAGTWARTLLPGTISSATYDRGNRLIEWNGTTLTYDDNGNLASEGSRTYGWDVRNRLTALGGASRPAFSTTRSGGGSANRPRQARPSTCMTGPRPCRN